MVQKRTVQVAQKLPQQKNWLHRLTDYATPRESNRDNVIHTKSIQLVSVRYRQDSANNIDNYVLQILLAHPSYKEYKLLANQNVKHPNWELSLSHLSKWLKQCSAVTLLDSQSDTRMLKKNPYIGSTVFSKKLDTMFGSVYYTLCSQQTVNNLNDLDETDRQT